MQLNKSLLLLVSLIQAYRKYTIDLGLLQESSGENKTDWYKETGNYYYGLDRKYFEAAGIRQDERSFRRLLHFDITKERAGTEYSEPQQRYFPDEPEHKENIVSSFFYYMWNAWCEEECKEVYGPEYSHFWDKWRHQSHNTPWGAAEKFYAGLTTHNRAKLISRACVLYDGSRRRE